MQIKLPNSNDIDTQKLGRLFDNKAESYKLFWFQAIVNKVYEGNLVISYNSLINEMIADAWYMVSEYKLNLGPKDALEEAVGIAFETENLKSSEKKETILQMLEHNKDRALLEKKRVLTLNVPYRLQAPFLNDVKGKVWYNMKEIPDIINEHENLLYYFKSIKGLESTIAVTPQFAEYIHENYEIVTGWIRYNLVEYLQRRNPSVPGIINKIDHPQTRNLEKVKKYWKEVIKLTDIHDIYHNEELTDQMISIDHFVPWSYVAHDELWNLTPTTRSINSSKSNSLPDWNRYFEKLSRSQYAAYRLSQENAHLHKLFTECGKEHLNDLGIRSRLYKEGISETEFRNRLEEVVYPVYKAAKNLGFKEWSI